MTGGQAEMREDLGNHGGIYDGGDDLQGSAALETLFNIDIEHPFEQPGESLMRAGTKYLNQIFIVTREVRDPGGNIGSSLPSLTFMKKWET